MQTERPARTGSGFRARAESPATTATTAKTSSKTPATAVAGVPVAPVRHSADSLRGWLLLAALAWLAFCIYGSLVPLNYRPVPWEHALLSFRNIRFLDLGIGSRADWVANILLFVPLGFLWTGVLWPRRGLLLRLLVMLLVFVLAVLLSLGIEFTQIFFPPRTVSQNDILAEGIGAAIGIGLWVWLGAGLTAWVSAWQRDHSSRGMAGRLFWFYLLILFGYNLLPLDLTISPIEIYHKWQLGRVALIPFSYPVGSMAEHVYALLADMVIWIPAALLLQLGGNRPALQTWMRIFAIVLLLEFLQLLVWSRVSDSTDLITGAAGAAIGVWLALRWQGVGPVVAGSSSGSRWLPALAMFVVWTAVLAAIFWYPYDFQADWNFLRSRFAGLNRSPLHIYYYGTEFRAITELIHKVGFFIPLGVIIAWLRLSIHAAVPRRLVNLLALLLLPGVAMMIELGQVALPGKYPDISDWLFESLGGIVGYAGTLYLAAKVSKSAQSPVQGERVKPRLPTR